jgi:hypothetical protein
MNDALHLLIALAAFVIPPVLICGVLYFKQQTKEK